MEGGAKSVGGLPIVPRKGCLRLPSCEAEADSKQPVADADQVSLLSWNILADTLLQKNVREYAHIPEEWKDWGTRRCAIVDELVLCDADVICLQEVEFTAFETDLLPALEKVGYAGAMQNDKKRVQGHCQGVATFWKQSKLSEKARHSRSRTLMTLLTDSAGRNIAICNVHLEGHPMKSAARVKQLQNTLRDLSLKHNHQALVVAGDFNCQMQSSACGAYLSFGSCPAGVLEWGSSTLFAERFDVYVMRVCNEVCFDWLLCSPTCPKTKQCIRSPSADGRDQSPTAHLHVVCCVCLKKRGLVPRQWN